MKECFVHIIICSDNRHECVYRQHHHVCTNGRLGKGRERKTEIKAQRWNTMGKCICQTLIERHFDSKDKMKVLELLSIHQQQHWPRWKTRPIIEGIHGPIPLLACFCSLFGFVFFFRG